MKIRVTDAAKRIITVSEMPKVRKIVEEMRGEDLEPYCKMAARVAGGNEDWQIFNSSAEISKNGRIWDRFDEGTGNLDVWITFFAFDGLNVVLWVGVYLTDLWSVTGSNDSEVQQHMYIDRFKRVNDLFGEATI